MANLENNLIGGIQPLPVDHPADALGRVENQPPQAILPKPLSEIVHDPAKALEASFDDIFGDIGLSDGSAENLVEVPTLIHISIGEKWEGFVNARPAEPGDNPEDLAALRNGVLVHVEGRFPHLLENQNIRIHMRGQEHPQEVRVGRAISLAIMTGLSQTFFIQQIANQNILKKDDHRLENHDEEHEHHKADTHIAEKAQARHADRIARGRQNAAENAKIAEQTFEKKQEAKKAEKARENQEFERTETHVEKRHLEKGKTQHATLEHRKITKNTQRNIIAEKTHRPKGSIGSG